MAIIGIDVCMMLELMMLVTSCRLLLRQESTLAD